MKVAVIIYSLKESLNNIQNIKTILKYEKYVFKIDFLKNTNKKMEMIDLLL
jgi:hypothetical protein